jgi:heavy metal sensor kinase
MFKRIRGRLKSAKGRFGRAGKMTIGAKIGFMYAGIFAFVLLTVSVIIVSNVIATYRRFSLKELEQTAEKAASHIESGGALTAEALRELNPNKYVEVGISLVGWEHWANNAPSMPSLPPQFTEDGFAPKNLKPGQVVRIRAVQYMFGQRLAHYQGRTYLIMVFRNYQREAEMISLFTTIFVLLNILGVGASAVVGRTISHLTLSPIRRIIQTAERIGIADLSQRIQLDGPNDEIKELSVAFNDMIARLETSFVQQNQFVSDASHELRTPISVIQGYANLIDRWGKNNPEVLQESIDSIKAETEHMSMLVKKLLFMAKTDQKRIQLQRQPLYLGYVAEEVAREMSVMSPDLNISLETEGTGLVLGDYDLIKQLLWIFLENAIKYSKNPGDPILLRVTDEKGKCRVSIKDHGIGIKQEDLPFIFERFYRADKSRSNGVPGTGLGLSIASWIIRQHGASVDVASVFGEGTEVIIHFTRFTDEELSTPEKPKGGTGPQEDPEKNSLD